MFRWQSWKLWSIVLVVCIFLGIGVGVFFQKQKATPNLISKLSNNYCRQFFDKPIKEYFSLRGTLVGINNNNLLIKFNEEEVMWVSLREGYKVTQKDGTKLVEKNLDDLQIGASLILGKVGLSSRLENLLYADLVGIE